MASPSRERVSLRFGPSSLPVAKKQSKPNLLTKAPKQRADQPHVPAYRAGSAVSSDPEAFDHGLHEPIIGFGKEGAEMRERREGYESRAVLVIPRQANRDWRTQLERRKQDMTHVDQTQPVEKSGEITWGLNIPSEKSAKSENAGNELRFSSRGSQQPLTPAELNENAEALDALLNRPSIQKEIIMPTHAPLSEDDAYRRDAARLGDVSTLADYEAMPVEEFGAALLRGMGWNGEVLGPKAKEVRRRSNRLGLGAKELIETEDLSCWNQDILKKRRLRLDEYRRDKDTRRERLAHRQQQRGT